jgi:PilZ domain
VEHQVVDRRLEARFAPPAQNAARATLRPGCVVALVDVSRGGALVEGPRPLRPGSRVHLQVTTAAKTFAIEAQVTRCVVWILDPIEGVRYRGALRFEEHVEWTWGDASRSGYRVPESAGPIPGLSGNSLPGPVASRAAAAGNRRND